MIHKWATKRKNHNKNIQPQGRLGHQADEGKWYIQVSNEGGKNLAVFIASGKSSLKVWNCYSLRKLVGKTFQEINLSLNLIEDEGSVPLLKAISLDKSVQGFSLSSNRCPHWTSSYWLWLASQWGRNSETPAMGVTLNFAQKSSFLQLA